MEIEEIQHKICCNEMSASQVFTQMLQHVRKDEPKPDEHSEELLPAVSGCKCLVEFAVSSTLIKDKNHGTLNIINDLRRIKAVSKEEAVGKYMIVISEEFPDHYVHVRPCAMEI